jgi:hypothetical protein
MYPGNNMGDKFEELFQKALAAVQAAEAGQMKLDVKGTCQACFNVFVVKRTSGSSKYVSVPGQEIGKIGLVLHGFARPGHGSLEGMCWGAGRPPYELSCELTKEWRHGLVTKKLPALRETLEGFVSGRIKKFEISLSTEEGKAIGWDFSLAQFGIKPSIWATEGQPLPEILQKRITPPNFVWLRKRAIEETKGRIASMEKFIKFLDERIRDWRYAPDKFIPRQSHSSELSGMAWFHHPQVQKLMAEMPAPEGPGAFPFKSFIAWALAFPRTLVWTSMGSGARNQSYYRAVRKEFDKMPAVKKAGLAQSEASKPVVPPERQAKEDQVKANFKALIEDDKLSGFLKSVHESTDPYGISIEYNRHGTPAVAGQPTYYDKFVRRFDKAQEHDTHGDRMFSLKRVVTDLKDVARARKIKVKLPKA